MRGYVVAKESCFYAVIYEGVDPITGRERRRWHAAGPDRDAAEQMAKSLAAKETDTTKPAGLTLAVYLQQRWLPAKKVSLRPSTWDSYRRRVVQHVLPRLGTVPLRRLRPEHLENLYADLLVNGKRTGVGLDSKSVLEVHIIIRKALSDALRRGLVVRNVAAEAEAPKRRRPNTEVRSWTAVQLQAFLDAARSHRLFAAFWCRPTPACAAASSWGCAGVTSTSPGAASWSTGPRRGGLDPAPSVGRRMGRVRGSSHSDQPSLPRPPGHRPPATPRRAHSDARDPAQGTVSRQRWQDPSAWSYSEQECWAPLVSAELWQKVNARITNTRGSATRRPRSEPGRYLFAGAIRCGHCGKAMFGATGKNKPYYRYAATRPDYATPSVPGHPPTYSIREERILAVVDDWLATITDPDHLDSTVAAILAVDRASDPEPPEVMRARRQQTQLRTELERMLAAIRAGMDS